jgi:hypothetical protein
VEFTPQLLELGFEDVGCPAGTVRSAMRCIPNSCRQDEIFRAGKCDKPECVPSRVTNMCCPKGSKWNPRTRTCEPPDRGRPDLEIVKIPVPCLRGGVCGFIIRVTNVGDAPYTGPVLFGDFIMPGNLSNVTGPAGWNCAGPVSVPGSIALPPGTPPIPPGTTAVACGNPNATIAPGDPPLEFRVQVPAGQSSRTGWRNCAVVVGDPAKETNYGNNRSCVEDLDKPDLKVEKRLLRCTREGGGTVRGGSPGPAVTRCTFEITVTNVGNAPYTGEIVVNDVATGGASYALSTGWTCPGTQQPGGLVNPVSVPAGGVLTCRHPGPLAPQASAPPLYVNVTGPEGKDIKNCAELTNVAGDQNAANNRACSQGTDDRPGQPNITVGKTAPASCTRLSQNPNLYRCVFTINVTNNGTADLTGEVTVSDVTSSGRLVEAGLGTNWSCTPSTSVSVCRNPGGIRAGETQTFTAVLEVEVPPAGRQVENCVYNGEFVRGGFLPTLPRTRFASSEVPRDLLLRLAEGPVPGTPSGGTPGGAAPPDPATAPDPATPPSGQQLRCVSVNIPPDGTPPHDVCDRGLIPMRQASGPPRCCTPESIATGTCGQRETCGVGTTLMRDGSCCSNALVRRDGTCGPQQTGTCTDGTIRARDGSCCARQNLRSDGTCGPPPVVDTCPSPQLKVGNICCTREQIRDRTCGTPTKPQTGACKGKQIRNSDGNCQDPPGGNTGRCGKNQFRGDDGKCQNKPNSEKKRQPSCEGGRILKGRCLMPHNKQQPKPVTNAKPKVIAPPSRTLNPPIQQGRGR